MQSTGRGNLLKNLAVLLLSSVVSLMILELATHIVFRVSTGVRFDREHALAGVRSAVSSGIDAPVRDPAGLTSTHVLHPYLGFVDLHDPTLSPGSGAYVNSFGFVGPDPIQTRDPDRLIVGIFGGSVANILYRGWGSLIADRLQALCPDRQIYLICGSLAGYKQPQHLLALAYFLSLGAEFDIVITLDGYNEIALAYQENVVAGINPFFPRSWNLYSRNAFDRRIIHKAGEITRVHHRRASLARIADSPLLRRSACVLALWAALDSRANSDLQRLTADIHSILTDERGAGFQTKGPEFTFAGPEVLYDRLVMTWFHSSRQMAALATAHGFRYYHFLQPNQYHEGSKPLTTHERIHAYLPNSGGAKATQRAYPYLRAAGRRLIEEGVDFTDLSMLFENVHDDIYIDTCCHYNESGNWMVSKAITDVITADLRASGLLKRRGTSTRP